MTETREPVDAERDRSRPHVWPCRHCDMVDDYRLNRENEVQLAEGRFRQDEDYWLTTFKRWLQTFEWDSVRDRIQRDHDARTGRPDSAADGWGDDWADGWETEWAARNTDPTATGEPHQQARAPHAIPAQRTAEPDLDDVERAAQLTRWHADDHPTDGAADETSADEFAVHDRSA